jgi:hypothetical protein
MNATTEKTKNALIKKFHTLIREKGICPETKELILEQYGVQSTKDLRINELIEVCDYIANGQKATEDKWRKSLIASIFGWLKKMNRTDANMDMVKAIACRAAGAAKFNEIPLERLRSLYYAFSKKARDLDLVSEITAAEIDNLIHCN